ncbi:MAG TPA: CAP domain-containing protein [Pyrinomonadaceae bacterium]|nr:CAP domain-containing protein [Pyrinomonadaceae bacterium]
MIDEILAAHNKYRTEVGVEPLKWSESLAKAHKNGQTN